MEDVEDAGKGGSSMREEGKEEKEKGKEKEKRMFPERKSIKYFTSQLFLTSTSFTIFLNIAFGSGTPNEPRNTFSAAALVCLPMVMVP